MSICNSPAGLLEAALYRDEIERNVIEPPLFTLADDALARPIPRISSARKNVHQEIPAEVREEIAQDCPRCFEEWDCRA